MNEATFQRQKAEQAERMFFLYRGRMKEPGTLPTARKMYRRAADRYADEAAIAHERADLAEYAEAAAS